ncbi:hypothetical protein IQ07DRAFT_396093 [Pyrenochaeta sp. DS3sAY3a]|nr:hypothetical protein IQ07DRAFT_396093 [Pyrenochaeta sp. DS3sAY3a]
MARAPTQWAVTLVAWWAASHPTKTSFPPPAQSPPLGPNLLGSHLPSYPVPLHLSSPLIWAHPNSLRLQQQERLLPDRYCLANTRCRAFTERKR